MRIHKKQEFGKRKQHLVMFSKAISHPARISILKILARCQSTICSELVELMPLSQSTVSQHLKELKASCLVNGKTEGISSIYSLNKDVLKDFNHQFKNLVKSITPKKTHFK